MRVSSTENVRHATDESQATNELAGVPSASDVVRAEVNLLRFPLFALSTKGLRTLDGIECQGMIRRGGIEQPYLLRVTRNTASTYPGPLARRVHFALLGIASDAGRPIENPVVFSWRDLCRRIGTAYAGRSSITEMKAAIRSTHGILIHSQSALITRPSGEPLPALERGYHLYESYVFANDLDDDGNVSDANLVWFADWYIENLNRLYTAPVDFATWQTLDRSSTIASRLYEYLLISFHSGTPVVRINYANLALLLPVRAERYPSSAKKQMDPALQLLVKHGVIAEAVWTEGVRGDLQLALRRPSASPSAPRPNVADDTPVIDRVTELRGVEGPETQLVRHFHEVLGLPAAARPTPGERDYAKQLIATHGEERARKLIVFGASQLKVHWPKAKTLGALMRYLPEAEAELLRTERRAIREQAERMELEQENEAANRKKAEKAELLARWLPEWEALPNEQRTEIEGKVAKKFPRYPRIPHLFRLKCLEELKAIRVAQQPEPRS